SVAAPCRVSFDGGDQGPVAVLQGRAGRCGHLDLGLRIHPGELFTMQLVNTVVAWRGRDEEGQGLAEYALILALIAIVAIVALIFLGNQVSTILSTVGSSV